MADDKTVRGTNFTSFHAGPMEGWAQFHMAPPEVPRPARGKLFLRKFLESAGLEMSLNVVPPGKGVLCGFGGGCLAAVDDDLLGLGCGIAPCDQLVEVVAVALVGRSP